MHRCLLVKELVLLIMECLPDGDNLDSESLKTLASLARTSKWLSDPALNILWKDQTGFENILRCMPVQCIPSREGLGEMVRSLRSSPNLYRMFTYRL